MIKEFQEKLCNKERAHSELIEKYEHRIEDLNRKVMQLTLKS